MGPFGVPELLVVLLIVLILFGYKKLPDASRALGRSLRIFKGEMKGMKEDDVRTKDAARTTPLTGEVIAPAPQPTRDDDLAARLQAEARDAELRAAEARDRADRARSADSGR
jgi:sec-independent protein translocase protein TatA